MAIREYNRPMMSDEVETAQTISMMEELADRDTPTRAVVLATYRALNDAGIDADADPAAKACAIFWFLKRTIRYVHVPGTSPLVDQTLIPPATMIEMPDPEGDCAQFSMLASAMLRVCCVPSCFKTIAADPDYPDTYSHVYNMVDVGDGFMPFDSSNGPSPGAEYARIFKSRLWPQQNPPRCKETSMVRTMRPNLRPKGYRNSVLHGSLGIAFRPLSGLRDVECDQDGNCYTDGVLTSSATDPTYTAPGVNDPGDCLYGANAATGACNASPFSSVTSPLVITGGSSPSASGPNAYSLATALAADAAAVAAPIVKSATQQAPYYITNPVTGQSVLYNPNTGTTGGVSAAISSLSPSTLLIGLALLAAFAFAGKK